MFDAICRYLISKSLDAGTPPPRWVARRIGRSAGLRAFRASVCELHGSLRAAGSRTRLDTPPFLVARVRAAVEQGRAPRAMPASPWRRLAPVLAACALLVGAFAAARFLLRPEPPRPRGTLGQLFGRFDVPSPERVTSAIETSLRNEARQVWDETRAAVELVAARLPSPPTLRRPAAPSGQRP